MTKYLSKVLSVPEYDFAQRIARLEHASLQKGVDIKLTTDIRSEVRQKITQLGLDPNDTTAEELFQALQQTALSGDTALRKKIGIATNATSVDILTGVSKSFEPVVGRQKVWAIKRSTLKKILKAVPPLKTMKILHYRSEVSLFKREQAHELYALAYLLEGSHYQEKIKHALKKLKPSDFEEHSLGIVCFSEKRWNHIKKHVKKQTVPVFSLPEIATITVIPVATDKTKCLTLLSATLLLCETKRIKEHATYLKLKTLDPHLHLHVQSLAEHGKVPLFTLHGQQVYWHHIHHVMGRRKELPEEFHPHMSAQDLEWLNVEAQLSSIEPHLSFWIDTHRLAFASELHVVSLHILDVAISTMYGLDVNQAQNVFVKETISDELYESYLELPPFNRFVDDHVYKLTDTETEILYD